MNYQFVNITKQYLHFLQTVPLSLLTRHKISETRWQEHLTTVRTHLRQRELRQEDAVLFFTDAPNISSDGYTQSSLYLY